MGSKSPSSGKTPAINLDFCSSDDAWYGVELVLQDETLIVKYCDFSDEFNDRFSAGDFKSAKEVEEFAERFRPTSLQLQDEECRKVFEGVRVCVSHKFSDYDFRFFDAIVEAVNYKDHIVSNGEEVCKCTFEVFWQHGPNAGIITSTSVEHICLLQPGNALSNPILASFLNISREKVGMKSSRGSCFMASKDGSVCDAATTTSHDRDHSIVEGFMKSNSCKPQTDKDVSVCTSSHNRAPSLMKSTSSKPQTCRFKETKTSKRSVSAARANEGQSSIHWKRNHQDVDLGGKSFPNCNLREVGLCHFILIENLEKDLAPSTMVDFVKRHVSVLSQAYVFPYLSSESYTRGIISVDSQEKLLKLSDFLHNPAHMILSSRGRPWAITEKEERHNAVGVTLGKLQSDSKSRSCDENLKLGSKLKIVTLGTDEYRKGKQLMELFIEFAVHIKQLHKKLASEERKIMQSSENCRMST